MNAIVARVLQFATTWLLEKAAAWVVSFIAMKNKIARKNEKTDQAVEELKNAKTEEEVKDAAKNTLGL